VQVAQNVDVILHDASDDGRALEVPHRTDEVARHHASMFWVAKEWVAVFRAEHDVDEDVREGLRHGVVRSFC
jgi:hypothetical protein